MVWDGVGLHVVRWLCVVLDGVLELGHFVFSAIPTLLSCMTLDGTGAVFEP